MQATEPGVLTLKRAPWCEPVTDLSVQGVAPVALLPGSWSGSGPNWDEPRTEFPYRVDAKTFTNFTRRFRPPRRIFHREHPFGDKNSQKGLLQRLAHCYGPQIGGDE
jgi:hypothetical protein